MSMRDIRFQEIWEMKMCSFRFGWQFNTFDDILMLLEELESIKKRTNEQSLCVLVVWFMRAGRWRRSLQLRSTNNKEKPFLGYSANSTKAKHFCHVCPQLFRQFSPYSINVSLLSLSRSQEVQANHWTINNIKNKLLAFRGRRAKDVLNFPTSFSSSARDSKQQH